MVTRLKAEANRIREQIESNDMPVSLLREKLQGAINALAAAQAKYIQKGDDQSDLSTINESVHLR